MKKVLLIGNDINNATPGYSWADLLEKLIDYANLKKGPSTAGKPFPLLYEEIFLNSAKLRGTREGRIKFYIASLIRKLKPNAIHKAIIALGIQDILTTNYDSTLEKSVINDVGALRNTGVIKEARYSLFRKHSIGKFNFWHIHGYEKNAQTITLGYEQYGGLLQQMRNYVATGTRGTYKRKDFQALSKRLKENTVLHESWIDYFFTHDVHIFALNLDFIEIHLWWLLTYRARAKILNRVPVTNTIFYYYPKKFEKDCQNKLTLLNVNEVVTVPLPMKGSNRKGYYRSVVKKIKAL